MANAFLQGLMKGGPAIGQAFAGAQQEKKAQQAEETRMVSSYISAIMKSKELDFLSKQQSIMQFAQGAGVENNPAVQMALALPWEEWSNATDKQQMKAAQGQLDAYGLIAEDLNNPELKGRLRPETMQTLLTYHKAEDVDDIIKGMTGDVWLSAKKTEAETEKVREQTETEQIQQRRMASNSIGELAAAYFADGREKDAQRLLDMQERLKAKNKAATTDNLSKKDWIDISTREVNRALNWSPFIKLSSEATARRLEIEKQLGILYDTRRVELNPIAAVSEAINLADQEIAARKLSEQGEPTPFKRPAQESAAGGDAEAALEILERLGE